TTARRSPPRAVSERRQRFPGRGIGGRLSAAHPAGISSLAGTAAPGRAADAADAGRSRDADPRRLPPARHPRPPRGGPRPPVPSPRPATRAAVEAVRGVGSNDVLERLLEKGLTRPAGRDDSLGRPTLYETTKKFLQLFGLRSLRDLPPAEGLGGERESNDGQS